MEDCPHLLRWATGRNAVPVLMLSGDTRDVEKMNDGVRRLSDDLRRAQEILDGVAPYLAEARPADY